MVLVLLILAAEYIKIFVIYMVLVLLILAAEYIKISYFIKFSWIDVMKMLHLYFDRNMILSNSMYIINNRLILPEHIYDMLDRVTIISFQALYAGIFL